MDNEQIHKIISQLLEDLPPASVSSEDINLLAPAKGVVRAAMLEASGELLREHGIIVDRLGDYAVVANWKRLRFILAQFAAVELSEGNIEASRIWMRRPAAALGNKRPINLLSTEKDYRAVIDLIGKLEHGVFP